VNRYALTFTVKPGAEAETIKLLSGYARPSAGGRPGQAPLLRRTTVLISGNRVVRVMEVAGDIAEALGHLAQQPQILAVEQELDKLLEVPRDLSTPAGVKEFLSRAQMDLVYDRTTPPNLLPAVPPADMQRVVVNYPVRAGRGEQAAQLVARGRAVTLDQPTTLAGTTIFAKGEVLVRVIDIAGNVEAALDEVAAAAVATGRALEVSEVVDTELDITTVSGFRQFLADHTMRTLTDRRVGGPA
jgi:hypothetical protein